MVGVFSTQPGGSSRGPSYGASQRVRTAAAGDEISSMAGRWPRRPRPRASAGRRPQVGRADSGRGLAAASRTAARDRTARRGGRRPRSTARSCRRGSSDAGDRIASVRCPAIRASTVYAVLARSRLQRLRDTDRRPGVPVRYVHDHPGCARPPGPQEARAHPRRWRPSGARPRARPAAGPKLGYDHFEIVIDDRTRLAVVVQVPDETAASAATPSRCPRVGSPPRVSRIERVLTDNGWAYRARAYAGRSWRSSAATSAPGPIDRRPTARPSGSSGTLLASGPTALYRSNTERSPSSGWVHTTTPSGPIRLGGITDGGARQQPPPSHPLRG